MDDKYKIKRIVYSTYQAVSGAGRKGVLDLENGIKNYITNKSYQASDYTSTDATSSVSTNNTLSGISNTQAGESTSQMQQSNSITTDFSILKNNSYKLEKFDHPIFSNCLPHIDVFLGNGYSKEEEKMINETRKILKKPDLKITATTVRVPVFNCHSESINVEFEKNFELEDLINTLSEFQGIIVEDNLSESKYPLATDVSGRDEVFVGRIRRDYSVPSGVNLWVVADNIRKGAATNAVQIVEQMLV